MALSVSSATSATERATRPFGFRGVGHMQSVQASWPGFSEDYVLPCVWLSSVLFCATNMSPPGSAFRTWSMHNAVAVIAYLIPCPVQSRVPISYTCSIPQDRQLGIPVHHRGPRPGWGHRWADAFRRRLLLLLLVLRSSCVASVSQAARSAIASSRTDRKSVLSIHIRCRTTPIRRASATFAFLLSPHFSAS